MNIRSAWILPVFFLTGIKQLHAQTQQKLNLEQATVFLHGAELTSTAKINLPQGESEILFTNVAGNVLAQSITVGADNNVVVQSATAQNNYLVSDVLSPRAQKIKDSMELLAVQKEKLADKAAVAEEQLAVLKENRKVTGEHTGLSVTELQKMLDLVNKKMEALLNQQHELDRQKRKIDERYTLLSRQLDEERKKDFQPGGQLLVKFYAKQAAASNITISYVVPNAGWVPSYDLRVDKINQPVNLFYKAQVYQNCGVKWDNIKLVLSTGNPNESAQAPTLNPWYLSFYTPQYNAEGYRNNAMNLSRSFQGNFTRAKGDAMGMAGGLNDKDELAVAPSTINQYVSVDNSGISTSFDIDLPYTIPSDGQQHMVAIKTYQLPATYSYYAVPRLDKDAFLQARITNWEDLNLVPGTTNVFYEGTYVGQGMIDMRNVRDTMVLSLGRDKKIIIRREKEKDYRAVKTIGSNRRQSYAYTISIRNTKHEPVNITLLEQFPVSNDKDIVIEDKSAPDAMINDENGAVKWVLDLKANETIIRKLSYTVKFPKDKTISNLY
jgi:uncharacterized protein (TIGR02231 family)